MRVLHWSLLSLYLAAAAAYGGWRGTSLWEGWGVWCLLVPPLAVAAIKSVSDIHQNPLGVVIVICLFQTVLAVGAIGGSALALAWMVAAVTGQWSSNPMVRAIIGVGLAAGGVGMA